MTTTDAGTTPLEVPEDHLPALLVTARREVSLLAEDVAHAEQQGDTDVEVAVAKLERAVAAWRDVVGGLPLATETVLFLMETQIAWECGDTDVRMPETVEECEEFAARLERQRFLIDVRDRIAVPR